MPNRNNPSGSNQLGAEFWVVFDTSTVPSYYRDVHNGLSQPQGTTIRCTYRLSHCTPAALAQAKELLVGDRVLCVYTQLRTYAKGDPDPVNHGPFGQQELWVALRAARMHRIVLRGENVYFDLKLLGYVTNDVGALGTIIDPLIHKGEVPWKYWIARSGEGRMLDQLCSDDDVLNWQRTVTLLDTSPSQFAGDTFWRVDGPRESGRGKPAIAVEDRREAHSDNDGVPFFELKMGERIIFDVSTMSAHQREQRFTAQRLALIASDKKALEFTPPSVTLRPYSTASVAIHGMPSVRIGAKVVEVTLRAEPEDDPLRPAGPMWSMRFDVRKRWIRDGVAILLIIMGGIIAKYQMDELGREFSVEGLFMVGLSALVAVIGVGVLTSRISVTGMGD
jgi:hypothetical protein